MTFARNARIYDPEMILRMPSWVTSQRAETLETVAFQSAAVMTVLDQLVSDQRHGVPVKLLANRLALTVSVADRGEILR